MTTRAVEPAPGASGLEREWWLRTLLVLRRPAAAFAALRDEGDDAETTSARQEPLVAVLFLSGIAIFLSTRTAGQILDDVAADGLVVAVEVLIAGALVALQNFWLGGGALYLGARALGGLGTYRRARAVVGLACMPFVVSLALVWPVRLALFGSDLFRSGGSDHGAGGRVFEAIDICVALWAAVLLVVGVRVVHGWSFRRSLGAAALGGVFFGLAAALFLVG